jgi:hypothetical protein
MKTDTNATVDCPQCNTEMKSFGGSFGGRISMWKKKCHACGMVVMIVPMEKEYNYTLLAETEAELDKRDENRKLLIEKRNELKAIEAEIDNLKHDIY